MHRLIDADKLLEQLEDFDDGRYSMTISEFINLIGMQRVYLHIPEEVKCPRCGLEHNDDDWGCPRCGFKEKKEWMD